MSRHSPWIFTSSSVVLIVKDNTISFGRSWASMKKNLMQKAARRILNLYLWISGANANAYMQVHREFCFAVLSSYGGMYWLIHWWLGWYFSIQTRVVPNNTMPSEWFKDQYKYKHLLDTCYEMAAFLPVDIAGNSVVTGGSFYIILWSSVRSRCSPSAAGRPKPSWSELGVKKKVELHFSPREDRLFSCNTFSQQEKMRSNVYLCHISDRDLP